MRLTTKIACAALAAAAALLGGCLPIELSVSPDGQILIPRQEGFFALDPAQGSVKAVYRPKSAKPAFGLYAPDGKSILAITQGRSSSSFDLHIVPVGGGEAKSLGSLSNMTYARWSPDGKRLAVTRIADEKVAPLEQNMPELIVLDAETGKQKKLASNVSSLVRWFADSRHVLTFQADSKDKQRDQYTGRLVKMDAASGKASPLAAVLGEKKVFFDPSPDGAKVLFTALKADAAGAKLPGQTDDAAQLFELDVAGGKVRAVMKDAIYAIYSPKGTKVLVGVKASGDALELVAADASLAKRTVVARDAAKSVGSTDTRDIYAGWIDDETVHYLRLVAVYGTVGQNLHLTCVGADGKGRKDLQTAIDSGIKD